MATQSLTADRALAAESGPADLAAFWRIAAFLTFSVVLGTLGGAITGEKTTFLFKEMMHLTPGDIGTLGIIVGIPAYLQPFLGAGSDLFPLFGSHRRSYYLVSLLVRTGAYWGLACLSQYHYAAVVCLLLVLASGGVLATVMVNAVMVAVGNRTRRLGQLQSLIVFVPAVLSIVYTARLSGYVTQNWSYHHAFGAAAVLMLLHLPLVLLIDEKPVAALGEHDRAHPALRRAARQEERARSAAALRDAARTPGLWAVIGLVFYLILTPGIGNAQIYYMTDVLHFSKQLIGSLGMYSSAGSIVSMGLFAAFSRRMPVRSLVWGAWLMDCAGYPILVLLHTPDSAKVIFFLGACIGTWYGLCLSTLAARACPPGVEGTVYGLVMSAIAIAGVLSDKIGGSMYDFFGPLNTSHRWTITHGWDYSLWVGLAFTLVGFVFIPFLPAWAKSREPLGGPGAPRTEGA